MKYDKGFAFKKYICFILLEIAYEKALTFFILLDE